MDRFFDEAARILASPMSRRQAFSRIGKIAAGALLAGAVAAPASAQIPGLGTCTTDANCNTGRGSVNKCCPNNGNGGFCAPKDWTCCGTVACNPSQRCAAHDDTHTFTCVS